MTLIAEKMNAQVKPGNGLLPLCLLGFRSTQGKGTPHDPTIRDRLRSAWLHIDFQCAACAGARQRRILLGHLRTAVPIQPHQQGRMRNAVQAQVRGE
jgi:hypothetical protein